MLSPQLPHSRQPASPTSCTFSSISPALVDSDVCEAQLHVMRKCGPRHCLSGITLKTVMLCRRCSCSWSSCCCSSAPPRASRRPLRCARTLIGMSSLRKSRLQNMPAGVPAAESKSTTLHCAWSSLALHPIALQPDDAVLTPACCAAFVLADLPADGGSLTHMRMRWCRCRPSGRTVARRSRCVPHTPVPIQDVYMPWQSFLMLLRLGAGHVDRQRNENRAGAAHLSLLDAHFWVG